MRDKQLAAVLHEGEEEVQGSSRRKEIQELLWACQSDNMAENTLEWEGEERRGKRRENKGERGKDEKGEKGKEEREGVETSAFIQDKSDESIKLINVCTSFRGFSFHLCRSQLRRH